jgi:hypothetical protein
MPSQPAFDLDLAFGQEGEEWLRHLLDSQWSCKGCGESNGLLVEVKTERDLWHSTGNLFFEFEFKGKPSGFITTKAEWWIHLLSLNGTRHGALLLSTERLRERLREMVKEGIGRVTVGGDYNASRGVLVPMDKVGGLFI